MKAIRKLLVVGMILYILPVFGVTKNERDSILNLALFASDDLLKIELQTDLTILINDVGDKRKYHSCKMYIHQQNGKIDSLKVKAKTRGNFRRQKQNCDFPPLRFKFSDKHTKGTVFEGQSKLKYVSHCKTNINFYDEKTVQEYLVYKMYEAITPYSYRARLALLTFRDTKSDLIVERFGFFIESRQDVALRNDKQILKYKNIQQYEILRNNMVMLSLFQLMIGNVDWSVKRLHNIDILSTTEHSIPVAIPYDFDWTSIVGHTYFTLSPLIKKDAKYKRIYKGFRWTDDEFQTAFDQLRELQPEFGEMIAQCKYLSSEGKNSMIDYLIEFYSIINSKRDVKDLILKKSPKLPQ